MAAEQYKNGIAHLRVPPWTDNERDLSRGTGFLIGEGRLLTALHGIADLERSRENKRLELVGDRLIVSFENPQETVELRYGSAAASEVPPFIVKYDLDGDWAILEVAIKHTRAALPTGPLPRSGRLRYWDTWGFAELNPMGAKYVGSVTDTARSPDLQSGLIQLHCEQAAAGIGAALSGLSGAPMFLGSTVVGIILCNIGINLEPGVTASQGGIVYALPLAGLRESCDFPTWEEESVPYLGALASHLASAGKPQLADIAGTLALPVVDSDQVAELAYCVAAKLGRLGFTAMFHNVRDLAGSPLSSAGAEQIIGLAQPLLIPDSSAESWRERVHHRKWSAVGLDAYRTETGRLYVHRILGVGTLSWRKVDEDHIFEVLCQGGESLADDVIAQIEGELEKSVDFARLSRAQRLARLKADDYFAILNHAVPAACLIRPIKRAFPGLHLIFLLGAPGRTQGPPPRSRKVVFLPPNQIAPDKEEAIYAEFNDALNEIERAYQPSWRTKRPRR